MLLHASVMFFGVLIASFSQIMLKKAASRPSKSFIAQYLNPMVITAYAIMVLSTLCTVFAYKMIPLSSAPVWDATGQVAVTVLSFLILHEGISKRKRIGFAVIVLGFMVFML